MIDEATATYILENQRCFEDLKQVASQLAGLLVLAASGSKEAVPDHPMLDAAGQPMYELPLITEGIDLAALHRELAANVPWDVTAMAGAISDRNVELRVTPPFPLKRLSGG